MSLSQSCCLCCLHLRWMGVGGRLLVTGSPNRVILQGTPRGKSSPPWRTKISRVPRKQENRCHVLTGVAGGWEDWLVTPGKGNNSFSIGSWVRAHD